MNGATGSCEEFGDASLPGAIDVVEMPADLATGVLTTASISAMFTVELDGSTIGPSNVKITASAGPVAGFLDYDNLTASIIFTPNHLPQTDTVTVDLSPNIMTLDGRSIGHRTWQFVTETDLTAPTVSSAFPSNGSTGNPVFGGMHITLIFDEDVTGAEGRPFGLVVSSGGTPIAGAWSYAIEGYHLTQFTPDAVQLPGNATIDVTAGGSITDFAGNQLVPFSLQFGTGVDDFPPFVFGNVPQNNDNMIPTDTTISVTFNEAVANVDATSFVVADGAVPITGTIATTDQITWVFTPDATLPAASLISVTLAPAITDIAGNSLGTFDYSFTTL